MINEPIAINERSFQIAWINAVKKLMQMGWRAYNLVVQFSDIQEFDEILHERLIDFYKQNGLLTPKHVAYTIFPYRIYESKGDREKLFNVYNKPGGLYDWTRKRPRKGWGTYFRRMTSYRTSNSPINQLNNIITAINERKKTWKSSYTILIQFPGNETIRPRGGPCLNYISIQMEHGSPGKVGLLAIYRNHDFLERAYGNYYGLSKLLGFMCKETDCDAGPITCISSYAFIENKGKRILEALMESL